MASRMPVPRDTALDATLAFLSEGYRFIPARCERLGSDIFETRLMLRRVVCMSGEEAARVFYRPDRFTRRRAMPPTTLMQLQDRGSVQLLDGEAHRRRKAMFMALMTEPAVRRLVDRFVQEWRAALPRWQQQREVIFLDAIREVLCRAVCAWAGVPLSDEEARARTREFGAMIDGAGAVGPRAVRGLALRTRTERWARHLVRQVRSRRRAVLPGSPIEVIAEHRERGRERMDVASASVELLNLLRPTVAVDRYITFAALALHQHPQCRPRLEAGDAKYEEMFAQEVRRFYPFFPAIGGRVREPFEWRGRRFKEGEWVLLDLYGTLHDARVWHEPDVFRPERFERGEGGPFSLIPQGAGEHRTTHRCPGEWITIAIVTRAVRFLVQELRYELPPQDLTLRLDRMPTHPASGLRMLVH